MPGTSLKGPGMLDTSANCCLCSKPIADAASEAVTLRGGGGLLFCHAACVAEEDRSVVTPAELQPDALLAAIVESSDDAIVSKTLDGIIMSWNSGASRLFGYTPQEAIGKSIQIIIPEDRRDEETTILARLKLGQ